LVARLGSYLRELALATKHGEAPSIELVRPFLHDRDLLPVSAREVRFGRTPASRHPEPPHPVAAALR
jgi:hypothetical protein